MLRKFWYFVKAEWQETFTYRSMLAIWMFSAFFAPLVMLAIWLSVLDRQELSSFSRQMFVTYYLILPLVRNMTGAWAGEYLPEDIRSGTLLGWLIKPIHPIVQALANNLAEKFAKFWFLLPMVLVASLWYRVNPLKFSLTQLALALLAVAAGLLINFLLDWSLGLLGFWLLDPKPLREINNAFSFLLGGLVLPLALFPAKLRIAAYLLPYRYITSLPLEILTGSLSFGQILLALMIQAGWFLGFLTLLRLGWQKGLRVYQAYGG